MPSQSVSDRRRLKIGLSGPNNTYIATLVERQARYVMLAKVAGKDTRTVVTARIKQAKKLPKELDLGPRQGTDGSSSIYVGDQHRRLFLRSAKPVAAWIKREHRWPAETVLSSGHRLVGAFASPSEQSGSPAKRTTT